METENGTAHKSIDTSRTSPLPPCPRCGGALQTWSVRACGRGGQAHYLDGTVCTDPGCGVLYDRAGRHPIEGGVVV